MNLESELSNLEEMIKLIRERLGILKENYKLLRESETNFKNSAAEVGFNSIKAFNEYSDLVNSMVSSMTATFEYLLELEEKHKIMLKKLGK